MRRVSILLIILFANTVAADDDATQLEFFEKRIRPVLITHCYECHSSDAKTIEGGLRLDSRDGIRQGGNQGPAVVPGDAAKSLLLRAIQYDDDNLQMPPKEKLPAETIADFERWIASGAADPRTDVAQQRTSGTDIQDARNAWPFAPPTDPAVPSPANNDWPATPIDRFVAEKLEAQGLGPVADADRRTLIRRVTYDLIGLPPSPDEVAAFLADPSPNAFAAVVDRLLASPQYGERWGRHWLDVVRYADTAGDNSDYPIPQMFLYRNWVIDAWNEDKPYDRFILEQLAGDLLPSESTEQKHQHVIATGYIANARRFGSRVSDYPQHLTIEDTIDNLGRAFLGLSLNCARCHNHKFDPVTTEDYYAIYGVFHSTRYPWPGIELDKRQRDLVPLASDDEVKAALSARQQKLDELNAAVKAAEGEKKAAAQSLADATKDLDAARAGGSSDGERIKSLESRQQQAKSDLEAREKQLKDAKQAHDGFDRSPLPFPQAYAVAEAAKIENVKVQIKGDPEKLGTMVERRVPVVFGGKSLADENAASGRRQLAEWLASPENPLTARVIVNRLWHYHFGQGIVATPNDFGRQGKPPSHPELLDYLACRLVESGWSIKEMHRLILLSRTYQLSTDENAQANQIDPSNTFVWRQNRRRLDAESIRDSLLLLAGDLDPTRGHEHPFPSQNSWDFTQHNPFKAVYDTNRRSVYLMTQRIQRHPFLAIFDGPDTGASTGRRITSTTTLQALYLLNDQFVHQRAASFANRIGRLADDDASRIALAYEHALARAPRVDEIQAAATYLKNVAQRLQETGSTPDEAQTEAWNSFCRVLFRMNEFIYLN